MLPVAARRETAKDVRASPHVRLRPWCIPLCQLVEEYCSALKVHLASQGAALMDYVDQEFEANLKCANLEHASCLPAMKVAMPGILRRSAANGGIIVPAEQRAVT